MLLLVSMTFSPCNRIFSPSGIAYRLLPRDYSFSNIHFPRDFRIDILNAILVVSILFPVQFIVTATYTRPALQKCKYISQYFARNFAFIDILIF